MAIESAWHLALVFLNEQQQRQQIGRRDHAIVVHVERLHI